MILYMFTKFGFKYSYAFCVVLVGQVACDGGAISSRREFPVDVPTC